MTSALVRGLSERVGVRPRGDPRHGLQAAPDESQVHTLASTCFLIQPEQLKLRNASAAPDKRNFRKRILSMGILKEVGVESGSGRPGPALNSSASTRKLTTSLSKTASTSRFEQGETNMRSSYWSDDFYRDREAVGRPRTSRFAHDHAIKTGTAKREVHAKLDPRG